jgi:signal transduction histidine kinase
MISHEQRIALLEFLYRKPGVTLPDIPEGPQTLEKLIRDMFDELQHSKVQLREQITTLEGRNRELEDYAHMVAHDLKEPLTVLMLTADLINNIPDLTSDEFRECLLNIKSTAYEMKSIIKSLLLFSEVDKAEVPKGTVCMERVVANVQARLSHMIQERQAQLILPHVWPDALGYEPWIEEVWANLLSNALKYGGRPPQVELGASARSDGMVRFWTRDNGPGISPETRTRLFRRDGPISRLGHSGEGLGLPIVHNIVEKLGGQVGVESQVGQGSFFFFTLPAAVTYAE